MFKKLIITSAIITALFNSAKAEAMPLIGDTAPSFKAQTTLGEINFPNDYKGKWVVLFSHPADFTPVCTSEFMAFQKAQPKFCSLNTQLLGLSEDNIEQHQKWIESIKTLNFNKITLFMVKYSINHFSYISSYNEQKNIEISFPIIDDANQSIAKKYGMLQKDKNKEKTVRAVFVIDPESKVRAIIYYPQTIGRYIPEIQRLLLALQTTDAFDVATPANWMPGDDVIVSSKNLPEDISDEKLKEEGITKHSPYLYTKKLDKQTICDKLFE